MITFTARVKMIAGKEIEAMAAAKKMVEMVEQEEPGALAYICHQSEDNAQELVFYEAYADEVAAEVHSKTPHFTQFKSHFGTLFDTASGARIEYLDRIAGFSRNED